MAAKIKSELGIDSDLATGSQGIFRVELDAQQVFDKYDAGRFPEEDEVTDRIRELQSSQPGA